MKKQTIAVIFGGCSDEYEISLRSASAIIKSINRDKYDVKMLGINMKGEWFHFTGDVDKIAEDIWQDDCKKAFIPPDRNTHGILELDGDSFNLIHIDVAFPVLHGRNGEDGTIQGLLELANIPIVGCGTLPSVICMDKKLAHIIVNKMDIKVSNGILLHSLIEVESNMEKINTLSYPLFVKPLRSGSSLGVTCVSDSENLYDAIKLAFKYDCSVIAEEKIEGFEVGCAVMGNGENLITGELDEIELTGDAFNFTEKYTLKNTTIHSPARIPTPKTNELKETAKRIYLALGCQGFARVDMFLTPSGDIFFNEVNTIPGFTEHSRFPIMMKKKGYSFSEVVNQLIEMAVAK